MKHLNQFVSFACQSFLEDKTLTVTSCMSWLDYNTKAHMGSKLNVVITEDRTTYRQKDGESVSNLFEKFTVKVPKDLSIPAGSVVSLVNPVGTVYGEYRNQLSVTAEDVQIVPSSGASKTGKE